MDVHEKIEESRIRARDKIEFIERKRKAVEFQAAVDKKKIEVEKELEKKVKADVIERERIKQDKRKNEKTRMDHLREKMDMMKITKKYSIPEGFNMPKPNPPENAPESTGEDAMAWHPKLMPPPESSRTHRDNRNKSKRKTTSAGGDVHPQTRSGVGLGSGSRSGSDIHSKPS